MGFDIYVLQTRVIILNTSRLLIRQSDAKAQHAQSVFSDSSYP